ncbi:MAG: CBS domain-containing protein [Chloroflexales bacterium]|nr:CBS domain-containing protein [Chloroflexales bacterium]
MEAAQLMIDHRIGGIPVVDDNQLVGIITESDLFRLIIAQQKETANDSKDF